MDFDDLKKWVSDSWKAQSEWREQAESDFAFVDGHQWTDSEKNDMEDNQRIPIVFNRTAVIIGSVAGSEINNRTEVRFIPREIGDVKPNEVLTAGGEWFRDQSDAEDADSEAFQDLLVCGLGVTDTGLDFEADPEGDPDVNKIDPLSFGWDHYARARGLTDSRYFFEVKDMPADEAKERFEGKGLTEIHAGWIKKAHATRVQNEIGDEYDGEGDEDEIESRDTVTVVRVQYRTKEKFVEYVDPMTGQRAKMPAGKWAQIEKRVPIQVPNRKLTKFVWRQAFLGATEVLETNHPDPDGSTFNVMTGHWDRKEKMFYGLLKSMRDPQKFANKWLSQTLHIIGANAKGGIIAEVGAVAEADVAAFEESWAAADSVSWVRDGKMGAVQPKPSVQMPAALMSLTEFAISAIRDTSGVNMELLGLRDANQPGILEYQRRQSAMTTLARFFDALRYYRKRQGHTILNMLRNHIAPTGRLVRIVKEDQVQYVPLAMNDDTAKYDVIVDDAPQAPNEKEKAWSVIEAMMPMLANAGLGMEDWADILEYSPLPSSFAEKVRKKALEQKKQGPDPMQQLQLATGQAELRKTASETQENEANAMLDMAKAAQIQTEARLEPVRAVADVQRAMPNPIPPSGGSPA
jgi:hypothetical protein